MNATGLLCDAFPMMDYTVSQEEQGDFLEKQYHTLKTMLLDPCHLVRITAIKVGQSLYLCAALVFEDIHFHTLLCSTTVFAS